MKYVNLLLITLVLSLPAIAQKKVTDETRSALLLIDVPVNAKCDRRLLTKLAVGVLLGMKTNPLQITVKSTEYLFWKENKIKQTRSATIIDSLLKSLTANQWTMAYEEKDDSVVWLLKDNRALLLMYIVNNNQVDLYVGELDKAPAMTFQ